MFSIVLVVLLMVTVGREGICNADSKYYTAALHEHVAKGNYTTDTTKQYIEKNLIFYEKSAMIAGQNKADIIVFPEFGIFPPTGRPDIIDDAQFVPDPITETWNPCIEPNRYNNSYILANLSCMARQNNIVLLANILSKTPCNESSGCPEDKFYIYNTNVAFNRSGILIARYRKTHLYFEDGLNVLPEPEFIVFQTDFAKIGTFICFDVAWKEAVQMVEKHKPDTVIISTMWYEYIQPGMNFIQIQQSWAIANNVSFLASNRQQPSTASLGSGVFFGDTGIGNYVYIPDGQSRLIISKVPKRGIKPPKNFSPATIIEFGDKVPGKADNNITSGVCSRKVFGPPSGINDFRCRDYDLTNFTLVKVDSRGHMDACNNGLCCKAHYTVTLSNEHYYLAVINGTYTIGNRYTWWLEACILVRCDPFEGKPCSVFPTKSETVFEDLKMEANFTTTYVYPSISLSELQLPSEEKWIYSDNALHFKTKTDKLLFATLYGRAYDRDPK